MNQQENPLFSLLFNILIPIILLNKGHLFLGDKASVFILILALMFPVFYGLFDFIKNKRKNIISLFGTINVLFTGGFALYKLDGIWFAVKEAAFPLLIGIFVFISAYTKKNFFEYLIRQTPIFKWDLIEEKMKTISSTNHLHVLFKKSTILFSISFFISAVLNFILALYIFSEKGTQGLSSTEKEILLNQKIADMTWLGFIVIGLPMTLFAFGVFWWFLKKLTKLTLLPMEQILISSPPKRKKV
ncbi:MAG: hypothetical protein OXM55_08355 [Bdellovibrionales bacterium]|nr:hypothetical protein [Bdellovibrionales bacterium]